MKILFINTSPVPIPKDTGHQIQNWGNIQSLLKLGHKVHLVILSDCEEDDNIKFKQVKTYLSDVDTCNIIRLSKKKIYSLNSLSLKKIIKEMAKLTFHSSKYFSSRNYRFVSNQIQSLIKKYDINLLWYEDFYVAIYDNWVDRIIPAVYDMHDNQSKSFLNKNKPYINNLSNRLGGVLRKFIINKRFEALERTELKTQRRFDVVLSGNSSDVKNLKSNDINSYLRNIPITGGDKKFLKKRKEFLSGGKYKNKKLKIMHLGNLEGGFTSRSLAWFLDEVWEELVKKLNNYDLELHVIGGGNPSPELIKNLNKTKVLYRGYVDNLWKEFIDTFVMLIPGKIITGVRIRVPSCFSMMVPAIGNRNSFHGMFKKGQEEGVFFAEHLEGYASKIELLAGDNELYLKTCERSLSYYKNNFSIDAASIEIDNAISEFIS